jgi:hypothetical protein
MSTPGADPPAPRWVATEPRFADVPGLDPELEWALGAGQQNFFAGGRQDRWMPVAIELQGISLEEFAAGTGFLDDGPSRTMWQASVRISPPYAPGAATQVDTIFFTAMVTPGFFEFFKRNDKLREVVRNVVLGLPLGAESLGPDLPTNTRPGKR